MKGSYHKLILATLFIFLKFCLSATAQFTVSFSPEKHAVLVISKGKKYEFTGQFTVLYSAIDPDLALRSAGIKGVLYNVPTWNVGEEGKADLKQSKRGDDMTGDGFDDKILEGSHQNRTANFYNSGRVITMDPVEMLDKGDSVVFTYSNNDLFGLTATVILKNQPYPKVKYLLTPKKQGYFSIGYTGAPAIQPEQALEIWQPLIWQEKRFPDNSYLTPSYMATLPTTLVNDGKNSIGVMASPEFLPFDPLPVFANSQFGISVRNRDGNAQPQVFAPIFGSEPSLMDVGKPFSFNAYMIVEPLVITSAYEKIARTCLGFKDYRKNDISTLNQVFDNIVEYSMTEHAWFVDSLKGFAYSTDVPEAVKNVSSLHPIELALVTDDTAIFEKRAYPHIEYMLSREKFLFALDSTQRIQSPSRKLRGPIAPISELSALYNIFGGENPFYKDLAKIEYDTTRIRNLDVEEKGNTWMTSLNMYRSTKNEKYLQRAIEGADRYLVTRVEEKQTAFDDEYAGGYFFWTAYTNKWIDLLELYEYTGNKTYLDAAHQGARYYTMFTWMAPVIPEDSLITVNKGGKAPHYGYLKSKGHKQMHFPEEQAPAWRLSEIGLTPESSGTSTGHRAIFMANYAPWMLRLGYYTDDNFLKEVAKAAIIGRYRNFPGYHINTSRTTAYEKYDFPMYSHKEQSVNSFHYNHIMPMASMLLDYLITDAYVRSNGQIDFPAEFIEGYAYLQNKFYGAATGKFYNEENIHLWMPRKLLTTSSVELNYIAGRRGDEVFLAFANQSKEPVSSTIDFDTNLLKGIHSAKKFIYSNGKWEEWQEDKLHVNVAPDGITVVKLQGVKPSVHIQENLLTKANMPAGNDYLTVAFGNTEAMMIRMGNYATRAFIYLKDDDTKFSQVSIRYQVGNGEERVMTKKEYPFEFTIELPQQAPYLDFVLEGITVKGEKIKSSKTVLGTKN